MERVTVKGNTSYLKGRQLIPLYQVDETRCILIDPGRESEREAICAALAREGLSPVGILLTHMHYDHHVNTGFFRERYGIPAAMSRSEAEICRNRLTLKNHLFNFTPGLIASTPRLSDLVCEIDRVIEVEETRISFQGAEFGIVHSPGHSPGHICIITPDNAACMGDAILCGESLELAGVPFLFTLEQDLETKRALRALDCDAYLVSHEGTLTREEYPAVVDANIERIEQQLRYMESLLTEPGTLCSCYERINTAMGQAGGHPIRNHHLERYLRPYLEYLADSGRLKWISGKGAPTLAPAGWVE